MQANVEVQAIVQEVVLRVERNVLEEWAEIMAAEEQWEALLCDVVDAQARGVWGWGLDCGVRGLSDMYLYIGVVGEVLGGA